MKPLLLFSFCLAVLTGVHAADTNQLTPQEKSAGWKLLFDGHSLTGWRSLESTEPGKGWTVAHGEIQRTAASGDLVTADEYGDFELSLEWKIEKAGNSGVIYRVGLGEKKTYLTGPEYQLLDNKEAHDNKLANHLAGSLYDLVAPPQDYSHPAESWNETRIIVHGWEIQHWLNGKKVVDIDLSSPAGKKLVQESKFKDMPKFATLARGHIALQDHDAVISFRNIKIKAL
jgi:hypothetical protein